VRADPTLRERTRREIRDVIHRVGITTLLVTHEQDEAFELGDRVAVMRGGRLEQVGTPDELYGAPANAFVAGFVGRSTTAEVTVLGPSARGIRIAVEGIEWDVDAPVGSPMPRPGPAIMLVRPEALRLTPPETARARPHPRSGGAALPASRQVRARPYGPSSGRVPRPEGAEGGYRSS
jgi:ABC-type Fe3+/spermidine/putrescine transport system ATPase subunit